MSSSSAAARGEVSWPRACQKIQTGRYWAKWGNDEWAYTKVLPYFRKLETDMDFGGVVNMSEGEAFKALIRDRVIPTDADLATDAALDDWLMRNIGTSHHVSCTCKMGPASDPMAVVSQYGQVHGLENVWVTDASIMPDCIRANTNATPIMIGERIAEFMQAG